MFHSSSLDVVLVIFRHKLGTSQVSNLNKSNPVISSSTRGKEEEEEEEGDDDDEEEEEGEGMELTASRG